MKTIIFITNSFPFGKGEASFIIPELSILEKEYKVVIVSRNSKDEQTTKTNPNIKLYRYNNKYNYISFMLMLHTFFSKDLYKEILYCIKNKKLTLKNMVRTIKFNIRSKHFGDFLDKVRADINEPSVMFYTYWNDYPTYSSNRIRHKNDYVISRIHGTDLYLERNKECYFPFKNITNSKTDKLFFISQEGIDYYKRYFKIKDDCIKLCRLGVKKQEYIEPYRQSDEISILSFSSIISVKRVDLIIKALAKINDTKINWTHIGGGVLEEYIKSLIKSELGNKNNINYTITGYMENKEAMQYVAHNQFDFLLNVSYSEGLPVTMMESMSLGIPVLATDVGGVSEIVNNKNGILFERDFEPETLAKKITDYGKLSFEDKLKMRNAAYQTWEKGFNSFVNYSMFVNEIKKIFK